MPEDESRMPEDENCKRLVCCLQVWSSSKEVLCRRLGAQTGASLWQHAHGIDDRPVAPPKARRTVGAEVNWGVRFSTAKEADTFLKVPGGCVWGGVVGTAGSAMGLNFVLPPWLLISYLSWCAAAAYILYL